MNDGTTQHDSFCPSARGVSDCQCKLIAQVRRNQHERTNQTFYHLRQLPGLFYEYLMRNK